MEKTHIDSLRQRDSLFDSRAGSYCDRQALDEVSETFREERNAQAVDALLPRLSDTYPAPTRRAVAEALGAIGGPRATGALLERLRDEEEDPALRQAAAKALGKIGSPSALGGGLRA